MGNVLGQRPRGAYDTNAAQQPGAHLLQSPDGGGAPPKARRLSTHRREKRIQARAAKRDKRAALAAQHDDEVGIAMGDINPLGDEAANTVIHEL